MDEKLKRPKSKGKSSDASFHGGRKISDLSRVESEKLSSFVSGLLADLKKGWESRPENRGKKVKYSELWQEYITATKKLERDKQRGRKAK